MKIKQNHIEAIRLLDILEDYRDQAIMLENAKFNIIDSPNLDMDTVRAITNKYKALDRLIKYIERKITKLCVED